MLISDCAALTLLDSSIPDVSVTVGSVGALLPSLRRSNPSSPFCRLCCRRIDQLDRIGLRDRARSQAERHHRDRAVVADGDIHGRRYVQRALLGEHRQAAGRRHRAVGADAQISGPGIGFLAVQALNGDVALAVDSHIEFAARALHDAAREIRAGIARHRVDPGRIADAVDRLADERDRIGAKADGIDVRDVVVVDGLRLHDLLRARHRHIETSIHWWRCL